MPGEEKGRRPWGSHGEPQHVGEQRKGGHKGLGGGTGQEGKRGRSILEADDKEEAVTSCVTCRGDFELN